MIINEDALHADKHLLPASCDLIIYDPPYGIGTSSLNVGSKKWTRSNEKWDTFSTVDEQYEFYKQTLDVFIPLLKPTGNIVVFGSFHSIYLFGELIQRYYKMKIINSIVWNKTNAFFNVTRSSLIEGCEHIVWAGNGKNHYFNYAAACKFGGDKQLRNVWSSATTASLEQTFHPHQKPAWLIQRIIQICSPPGGFVFDPMCGSGTTAVVCDYERRPFLCIEKDQRYFQRALNRFQSERIIYH